MKEVLDRRSFLRRGSAATAGLAAAGFGLPALLAACGSSSSSSSATTAASGSSATTASSGAVAPGTYGTVGFQTSWILNVEFAGEYIADTKGYYKQVGFDKVNILAGGPNVAQDSVVASGKAFIGVSDPTITGAAIQQGAPLVVVGAQYQKSPFAIMSMADKPINNPHEMIGKKIGVQSTNQAVWEGFLKANNIPASKVHTVPAQFDPSPLPAGQVDGWFSFITNEPIELTQKGDKVTTFLLADFNMPLVSEIYVTQKSTLSDATKRAQLKALLHAEVLGWHDSLANPAEGAQLAVSKYGGPSSGLAVGEQTLESKAQNKLILTPATATSGIFVITPEQVSQNVTALGVLGTKVTESMFDTSVLSELYEEFPALKTSPVAPA